MTGITRSNLAATPIPPFVLASSEGLSNIIGMKPTGINVSNGSAAGRTWSVKLACPAPDFDSVRLVISHHDAAGTIYKAIVAATDEERYDTTDRKFNPVIGGAVFKTLDSVTTNTGWRSVKWAGAASITAPAGSATSPVLIGSDFVPLTSVLRRDGSGYPFILARISVTGGTSAYYDMSDLMATATVANGGYILQSGWQTDATGAMVSDPANNSITSASPHLITVGFQFRCSKRGITLLVSGDSIVQGNTETSDLYSTYAYRAAAQITKATGIPCGYVNNGQAGQGSNVYSANALTALDFWKPSHASIQTISTNGDAITGTNLAQYRFQYLRGMYQEFISRCLTNGARPIIQTAMPENSYNITDAAADAVRLTMNSSILTLADGSFSSDLASVVTDGNTPQRPKAGYLGSDGVHYTEAIAIPLMATQLRNDVIKTLS